MDAARYDEIGCDYATTRREDPRLRDRVLSALGDSRTVVNVGAGTGSYEPRDRYVIAVEPSDVMAAQRPAELVPALRGSAAPLMLRDNCVDAAMAILTVHHWDDQLEAGVRELRRVARGPVVILTVDADVCADMWLLRDYLPEAAALDRATFPTLARLAEWLGGTVEVETVLTARDTPDWTLASFWAFARMDPAVVKRVVAEVDEDLRNGTWDRRYGHLRSLDELDVGMRLVVAHP